MEQTSSKRIGFFDLWQNPEVKMTGRLIILLFLLFLMMTSTGIHYFGEQFKKEYVESNAAMMGALVKEHPELQDDLAVLLSKDISDEDKKQGIAILSEYGISATMSMKFFPEISDLFSSLLVLTTGSLLLFFMSSFSLNFFFINRIYKRIRELTGYADQILEGGSISPLKEMREGDFSKLTHSFNRMRFVIQKNIEELQKEKQFLADLMSDISHQLKTPLAALTMYNDILTEKELSKEQKLMFLDQGRQQLERMNWLIQSLLKLAKLDVGAIQFQKKNASLSRTVQGSVEILKDFAVQKGVEVKVTTDEECFMKHDTDWLTEALLNVIKNAIEHTPSSGMVSVMLEKSETLYRIQIRDEGEGIEADEIHNIFKRFYKGKKNKKSGSVGIGLSLSKAIVEGHNGMIQVESSMGEGTTFSFLFPIGG
ncbi:sensor histidine kinase [Cytobacillus dafuensis]|uniref:histidine kinase n=1 Tax=Cytobacillus dafuensis TaxID=1742359 RepID=A0A5B8Z8W3_CYTDA|nr:HAMP domain-containing sensor histidine kinase [Cytobacillus dafuensis]QED49321.1 HAMP domain-containing histidine kinase [Cytobacillus dafuensis]